MGEASKAKELWVKIQHLARRTVGDESSVETEQITDSRETNQEELYTCHGIYLSERLRIGAGIKSVVLNTLTREFLFLYDDWKLVLRKPDGTFESFMLMNNLEGIIFVEKTNRYIAWSLSGKVKVLDASLKLISTMPANSKVFCLLYNSFGEEIITGNVGMITVWIFRSGNTILVPKALIRDGLSPQDEIHKLTIEETSSKNQRCFAVVMNCVLIFRLRDGKCIQRLDDLHKTLITDVMYFRPLQLLITSGQDGSIKTWNNSFSLQTVFVGHTKLVSKIMLYRFGPLFVSVSADGTLRIWNLDSSDEVDVVNVNSRLIGMGKYDTDESFYSYTDSVLYIWKLKSVYSLITVVGSKVKRVKTTTHPNIPMMSVYVCRDSCVRLICPKTGTVVTVLVLDEGTVIEDAVYAIGSDLLFVLLGNGMILKCSTLTNPCTIMERWMAEGTGAPGRCTQLCLYEFVVENQMTGNKWDDVVLAARGKKYAEDNAEVLEDGTVKMPNNHDRTILFGGCSDGTIVVYEWQNSRSSGKVSFVLQAHSEQVIAIAVNPGNSQIVSASSDNTIKLWRVFPFAQEALAPLLLYMSSETPSHLAVNSRRLCVAFQEKNSACFSIGMYRTRDSQRGRIEHKPDYEHTDVIVGICSCPKMRIFASASRDGTIKIWDDSNVLIKMIKLNAIPDDICFCTQRGDILVSIGNHVHKILHTSYLPKSYIRQMTVMMFIDPPGIPAIPVTEEGLAALPKSQKARLLKAHSSLFKLSTFVDELPEEEIIERQEETSRKLHEFAMLSARDKELELLRDGKSAKRKKPLPPISARNEAWDKYLNIFYNRDPVRVPDERQEEEEEDEFMKPIPQLFNPSFETSGFFALPMGVARAKGVKTQQEGEAAPRFCPRETRSLSIAVAPEYERSTSVDISGLGKRARSAPVCKIHTDAPLIDSSHHIEKDLATGSLNIESRRLKVEVNADLHSSNVEAIHQFRKSLTDSFQRDFRANDAFRRTATLPIAPDGFLPNSVVVALYKELYKKEIKSGDEDVFKPRQLTAAQLAELAAYRRKKQPKVEVEEEVVEEHKPELSKYFHLVVNEVEEEDRDPLSTPPLTPEDSPSPEPPPIVVSPEIVQEKLPREIKPLKPIEKLVTRPVVKETPKEEIKKPPTPPPSHPPVPPFISQFFGQKWLSQCFSKKELEEALTPWLLSTFVQRLLGMLKDVKSFQTKADICEAICLLNQQGKFDVGLKNMVKTDVLFAMTMTDLTEPEEEQTKFLTTCIHLLLSVSPMDEQIAVELMTQHVLGNTSLRYVVKGAMEQAGLKDPYGYFVKHMNSFSGYTSSRRTSLKEQCLSWLSTWMGFFQKHIKSLAGKIYRAKKGNVVRGTKSPHTPDRIKGILKQKEDTDLQSRKQSKTISFISDNFVDEAAENTTPIEAINYFCEMQHQQELERLKEAQIEEEVKERSKKTRDTVLRLPRIDGYSSLARLGETHKSICHPERETGLFCDFRLPPIYNEKQELSLNSIALHLKTLTLAPFPDQLDELLYEPYTNSPLVTLRTSRKYFVPRTSYVQQ